jgi:hypothetical protein
MFISIAIVDPKLLVIANVVKPVGIILGRPVYCVGVDPSLVDTLFAEERAKRLRPNGHGSHHSSFKPYPVMLSIMKVNSNDIYIYISDFFLNFQKVEQRFKRAWKGNGVCPPIKRIYKIIENKSFLLSYDQYKFV